MKTEKTRSSADQTRTQILKAAQTFFVKQGFAGTSISQIAKKAKINQSLIYHHFGSKQQLWKHVKAHLLSDEKITQMASLDADHGLEVFLDQLVRHRFMIYHQNPDLNRMISWQRLESSGKELAGNPLLCFEKWRAPIMELQKKKQIRQDLDPDVVCTLIMSIIPGAFMPHNPLLIEQNKYKSEACIQQVIGCLLRALS